MKKFHFTLEAVRTLRQRQEQDAMDQYAQALVARRVALERMEAVQREFQSCWQELRGLLGRGCAAAKAAQAHAYHRSLEQRREECAATLGAAERRVNLALNSMLAARQQREIVDKAFEKQKARHQRERLRGEQKLMDDLAGRRPTSILSWNPTGALS